jgi:hypothetical protein
LLLLALKPDEQPDKPIQEHMFLPHRRLLLEHLLARASLIQVEVPNKRLELRVCVEVELLYEVRVLRVGHV